MANGFGLGAALPRIEDRRLVTGRGQYTADVNLARQCHAAFVRSDRGHARILGIDAEAALAAPGVIAVLTGEDYAREGFGTTSCRMPRTRPDGSKDFFRPHPGLVADVVRQVGDPVAMVIAETAALADDACALVEVSYEDLPAVASLEAATRPDAPLIWPDFPGNVSNIFQQGDEAAVDAAMAAADHVFTYNFRINRVIAAPMEPRAVLAEYDAWDGRYTLWTDTQEPHSIRASHAAILGIPENQLRVRARDIGGGFGMKSSPYPEMRLCLWAARQTGRPVKWVGKRTEGFTSDAHGRDSLSTVKLGMDAEGRFVALKVDTAISVGAYLSSDLGLIAGAQNVGSLAGVYKTPAIHVKVASVFTNSSPTAPYRGAGRPEATFLLEAAIDRAAAELGIDRVELRRRNMIAAGEMPYQTGLTFLYDCGEFEKNLDRVLELAGVDGFAARQTAAARIGKLRGLGIVNAVERSAAGPRPEQVELRMDGSGAITVLPGTKNHGQGHETMYAQMVSETLGIGLDRIRVIDGDTDLAPYGHGTNSSRSAALGGAALHMAADRLIEKGRRIAAEILEASGGDLVFRAGQFVVDGTDRSIGIQEVARIAHQPGRLPRGIEAGFAALGMFHPPKDTYPNGAHVCEVEIDRDTGVVHMVGYWAVDDVGTIVNPKMLHGQIYGGIAQGVGQALMEDIAYDGQGQLLTATFTDYAMPRADDFCDFVLEDNPVPTDANPFGIKGAGEAGTVGALAATVLAVNDALRSTGAEWIDMPATPQRVWAALNKAEGRG